MDTPIANNSEIIPQPTSVPSTAEPAPQVPQAPAALAVNPALPNKSASVPEFRQCMASDPTINEEAINAILARGVNKKE